MKINSSEFGGEMTWITNHYHEDCVGLNSLLDGDYKKFFDDEEISIHAYFLNFMMFDEMEVNFLKITEHEE